MFIDMHTHIGRLIHGRKPFRAADMVRWMDTKGIDKAVILPICSPEDLEYYFTSDDALRAYRRYPDRLIPFCNVDPRHRLNDGSWDPYPIIAEYVERGCKGFGEILASLQVDDPRLKAIYRACGRLRIPVLPEFRMGGRVAVQDEIGLPKFETVLREFPEVNFIGHGPKFWAEIAPVIDESQGHYPPGKIDTSGRVDYLLQNCPNLYADLSAMSGYNALNRDREFAKGFLERNATKLLFGTDVFNHGDKAPIIDLLNEIGLSDSTYAMIAHENARKLLKL